MRCKKHLPDFSSVVGVCATCLRERLLAVVEAQSQNQWVQDREICQKSDINTKPPPSTLHFPCSVSPYIARRKSDAHGHDRRFYSTPLVSAHEVKKSSGGRLVSFFSSLFRSKSDNSAPIFDSGVPGQMPDSRDTCTSSPSWFSGNLRRNQARTFSVDVTTARDRHRSRRERGRGMSPSRIADEEFGENCSGYSSESSQGWRQTPRRTPARAAHNKKASGLKFCLSPLVRTRIMQLQPEVSGGEAKKSQLSAASSFGKNRSRKLANFGRYSNSNF